MGACREDKSIWLTLRNIYKHKDLRWNHRWIRNRLNVKDYYFWHDSFGRYINRYLICPLFGHRKVKFLDDGGCSDDIPHWHCFKCEQSVDPQYEKCMWKKEFNK